MANSPSNFIDTLQSLEALFGELSPASTLKEIDYVHPVYQRIIAASPFLTIASCGPEGLDVSPRAANEPLRMPTAGEIPAAVTEDQFDGASYDRTLPARQIASRY